MSAQQKRIMALLFIFCFAFIGLRTVMVPVDDAGSGRSSIDGDGYSDVNTLSAVRYFHDFGFLDSHFRPMHSYTTPDTKAQAQAYTHYPSMPDILVGVWSIAIDSTNEKVLRLFPILLSMGLFFFIFYFMQIWLGDKEAAFISSCLLVTSNYFICWSDTLHKHTFEEVFKWFFVYLLYRYFRKKSWLLVALMGFLAAVIMNISFEPAVFLSVTIVGLSIIHEKSYFKIFNRLTIVLGTCFVLGFVAHVYLNYLYFGSWPQAIEDLRAAFLYRTNQCLDPSHCGLTLKDYLQYPMVILNRIERFYWIPGWALIVLTWFAFRKWRLTAPQNIQTFWVLFAASVSWYLVMNQHAWAHAFVGKQSGILWAWVSGAGLIEYRLQLLKDWHTGSLKLRFLHGFFVTYILIMGITQQIKPIYWVDGLSRLF